MIDNLLTLFVTVYIWLDFCVHHALSRMNQNLDRLPKNLGIFEIATREEKGFRNSKG